MLKAHREDVRARLREVRRNLELIDYKIAFYRGKCADVNGGR